MSLIAPQSADDVVDVGELPPTSPPPGNDREQRARQLEPGPVGNALRGWLVTLAVALVGGVVRFWNLGFPTDKGTPIFDEKHYVPQAAQALRNGGYEDNPGYELIVHPPLGKQLIAIGEWIFGYDGVGWRFAAALAGTIVIVLVVRIARRLTGSDLLAAIAGVLLIADGLSHVQSRMGMLDSFLVLFVVAAFACLMADRDQVRSRLAVAVREGWVNNSPFGPTLGFRWWRFAAGVALGLGCGVKWSGAWFIVFFGVLSVVWSATARRSAGVERPWLGTIVRDLLPSLFALALIPILAYLATWWSWFASETAIDRHVAGVKIPEDSWIPEPLRALWYYSGNVLDFHTKLVTSETNKHPWESKPWTWPMGLRPMLYYYEGELTGCGTATCVGAIMLVGTPAMWWLAFPVLAWALWKSIAKLDWRYAAVLVGYGAGFLPWFTNVDRQMYLFYAMPMAPFLVLGIVLALGEILGSSSAGQERRGTGLLVVALYVGLVVANFVWLWPILNGVPITPEMWEAQRWLPSWR
ncbi:dolichyl-phosphate-mannose--protein mannosyltransferase [Saccharothrix espanaensis]|uniref:Polyprenol-phosphate-mannose--protein mannosyltransferase n=1 Tax=Saccharothrix espanaensis (strain ATCC 51144 / DSM 44229 / JCM 9112 / NBRC 15066 / NRRL 15764) TaxID=1179773 RepID=K0JNZ0_SACES|nr:Glycosyltransferase, family 39 [Saccharothrix espanaensis DSM 44229]